MLLTTEEKKEFLKTRFHQFFDIELKNTIEIDENSIEQFVNFVLPLSKLNEYYDIDNFKVFLNNDYNNVIFTPADNTDIIYDYEFYQGVYFIRMKPFSKNIRMHIIPKKYNASNTASNNPILFFKNNQYEVTENIFSCSDEYKRLNSFKNINLYYQENQELPSNGFYKFDIKDKTKGMKNLQINLGYAYNDTNPTDKNWHITGIIDESNENGERITPNEFTEYNESLVDANSDNRLDYTNKILQQKIKNHQIDWDDLYTHNGGFNNPHIPTILYDTSAEIISQYHETSDDMYYLFRGDCWTINNNYESSAAITSNTESDLTVTGTFRTQNDMIDLYWNSEDLIQHPYISYGTHVDYSGVVLEFDYEMSGCLDFSNNNISITIKTNDNETYYLKMNRFISDNHVTIDFDNLVALAGSSYINSQGQTVTLNSNVTIDVTNIKNIMFVIVPTNFVENYSEYTIMENVDFVCKITNITVTNGDICNEYVKLDPHKYRLCEGYDDFYNLNPKRIAKEMRKLGYVEWLDLYIGASHYYEKSGTPSDVITDLGFNHNRTEKMVLDQERPLNLAFQTWLNCYARELKINETDKLIISVSMENLQCPQSWRQKTVNGDYAITGWIPSTFFYSPCNQEAISYMKKVSEACLDIVVDNNMQPILQLGEAWWWWNENDRPNQPPCFYDEATQNKYLEETGNELPEYTSSWVETFDEATMNWLNQQLVEYSNELRKVVKDTKYKNGLYMALFFPPSVTDTDRVPPMIQQVNYLQDAYNPSKLDILQLEDYDWVITNNKHHNEVYSIGQLLGFQNKQLHYYGGFVQYPEDAIKFWRLIEIAMNTAFEENFAEVFVWAGSQIRRDKKMIGYNTIDQSYLTEDLYHKTLKYFNDDLYIEEDEKYHIVDWIEIIEE